MDVKEVLKDMYTIMKIVIAEVETLKERVEELEKEVNK